MSEFKLCMCGHMKDKHDAWGRLASRECRYCDCEGFRPDEVEQD